MTRFRHIDRSVHLLREVRIGQAQAHGKAQRLTRRSVDKIERLVLRVAVLLENPTFDQRSPGRKSYGVEVVLHHESLLLRALQDGELGGSNRFGGGGAGCWRRDRRGCDRGGLLRLRRRLFDHINAVQHQHDNREREGQHHAFFLIEVHNEKLEARS